MPDDSTAPRWRARASSCRHRGVRRGHDLPAQGARLAPGLRAGARARGQGRGPGAARLARRAGRPRHADVAPVRAKEPVIRQVFIGRGPDVIVPDALERKLYVIRKTAAAAIQKPQADAQPRVLRAQHELPHGHLQGPAAGRPGGPTTATCRTARRLGAGAGAPALLDQHLPRVAAGAPVPHGRAQRRDRSTPSRATSTGCAPRGRDEVAGARRRPEEALPDQLRRASPTPPPSTTRSNC